MFWHYPMFLLLSHLSDWQSTLAICGWWSTVFTKTDPTGLGFATVSGLPGRHFLSDGLKNTWFLLQFLHSMNISKLCLLQARYPYKLRKKLVYISTDCLVEPHVTVTCLPFHFLSLKLWRINQFVPWLIKAVILVLSGTSQPGPSVATLYWLAVILPVSQWSILVQTIPALDCKLQIPTSKHDTFTCHPSLMISIP